MKCKGERERRDERGLVIILPVRDKGHHVKQGIRDEGENEEQDAAGDCCL